MRSKEKFVLLMLFLIISLFVAIFSGYFGLNQTSIESFISINNSAAAFIYIFLFIGLTSLSFSVSAMTGFGVLFFSGFEIILYAMAGIMGSSIIHFYISRKLGKNYVRNYLERNGGKLERFDEIIEKDTFKTTIILSAIFFVPPTIPNFLGGVMKINLKKYAIATFLGNLPNTVFTVYLIKGILYPSLFFVYASITGLVIVTLISLYFYRGEVKGILKTSFPWIFVRKQE